MTPYAWWRPCDQYYQHLYIHRPSLIPLLALFLPFFSVLLLLTPSFSLFVPSIAFPILILFFFQPLFTSYQSQGQSTMAEQKLLCMVKGDSTAFSGNIPLQEMVDNLKKRIKRESLPPSTASMQTHSLSGRPTSYLLMPRKT